MKIQTNKQPLGSALVITLLTALVICLTLASYLTLVSSQNVATMRSMTWNLAIPVVEAGIEAALTHLHYQGVTNLCTEGWTPVIGGYGKTGTLDNGSFYQVVIEPPPPPPAPDTPVITCLGHVPAPLSLSSQLGMILGGLLPSLPDQRPAATLRRKVRVTTKRDALFARAMVADGNINMNGNNIVTDSFDSTDFRYSTNGKYDATKSKDNGDVATNSGLVNSVSIGNADIKGKVSTGPNGSVAVGSNGSIGDKAWVKGGNTGIQDGHVDDDMNMEILSVTLPQVARTSGYSGSLGGTNLLNGLLAPGYFKINSFSGNVLVTGDVTVYVPYGGSMDFTGQSGLTLAPGAKLKIYVGAAEAKISSNGIMSTGSALDVQYWGLDSNTSIQFSANGSFTGAIYAPKADFKLAGGGNNTYDFVGSSITKTVTMNGHFNFHYDEALRNLGPAKGYVVSSWNEVDPNQ